MKGKYRPSMLHLPAAAQSALVAGARDLEPVRGLTHGFYKYPARFVHHSRAPPSRHSRSKPIWCWTIMLGEAQRS